MSQLTEARDFFEESEALFQVVKDLSDDTLNTQTDFKDWTVNDVIAHLYYLNVMAEYSLTDESAFDTFMGDLLQHSKAGGSQKQFAKNWLGALWGRKLVQTWRQHYSVMWTAFYQEDPKRRVKWAGPSMSARSSISARLMETWAHGQAVFDAFGLTRVNTDRIKSIAVLGWNTFDWTFKNRGMVPSEPKPFLSLIAPGGAHWTFGDDQSPARIDGRAEEFCQVVTQTRNVLDTDLNVVGVSATQWMAFAQCFAGAPEAPPAAGSRRVRAEQD